MGVCQAEGKGVREGTVGEAQIREKELESKVEWPCSGEKRMMERKYKRMG